MSEAEVLNIVVPAFTFIVTGLIIGFFAIYDYWRSRNEH